MTQHIIPILCVTAETMQEIAEGKKSEKEIGKIEAMVASCVNCRRLWSKFWADYRNKAISA